MDAGQLDLTAKQHGEFAADREAKAGAAVFTRRTGIRLLKRFKYDLLFLWWDADAGIFHDEGNDLRGFAQNRMALAISVRSEIDAHIDVATCRELEGVGD